MSSFQVFISFYVNKIFFGSIEMCRNLGRKNNDTIVIDSVVTNTYNFQLSLLSLAKHV